MTVDSGGRVEEKMSQSPSVDQNRILIDPLPTESPTSLVSSFSTSSSTTLQPFPPPLSTTIGLCLTPFLALLRHLAERLDTAGTDRPVILTRAVEVADGRDGIRLRLADRPRAIRVRAYGLEGLGAALGKKRRDGGRGAFAELRGGRGAVRKGRLGVGWFAEDAEDG